MTGLAWRPLEYGGAWAPQIARPDYFWLRWPRTDDEATIAWALHVLHLCTKDERGALEGELDAGGFWVFSVSSNGPAVKRLLEAQSQREETR